MAKIICNQQLPLMTEGAIWSASNGATRRTLILINKIKGYEVERSEFFAQIAFLDKGNHSFIFLNQSKQEDKRVFGLFLNKSYSFDLVSGKELFSNTSSGGYGNSCSKFGIYEVGTILKEHTYKNRNTPTYYRLTEDGWQEIPPYEVEEDDNIQEL